MDVTTDYIQKLIDGGQIQQKELPCGNGKKNCITFPDSDEKYIYNGKTITKKIKEKILKYNIYTMPEKRLNKKNTEISTIDVELKFDEDKERKWVNKDKWLEFTEGFKEANTGGEKVNVDLFFNVRIRNIETEKMDMKKVQFPTKSITNTKETIQLYIKKQIIDKIRLLEDSKLEILAITNVRVYLDKTKYKNKDFKNIKMFASKLNYKGFNLDAIETEIPNTCVPTYLM